MTKHLSNPKCRRFLIATLSLSYVVSSLLDNYEFLLILTLATLAVFLFTSYAIFYKGFQCRFFLLSSQFCGTWLTLGFLISYLQDPSVNTDSFQLIFRPYLSMAVVNSSTYSLAMAYVMLFILSIDFISEAPYVKKSEAKATQSFQFFAQKKHFYRNSLFYKVLLVFLTSLFIWISSLGLFKLRTIGREEESALLPWWYPILSLLLGLFPTLICIVLNSSKKQLFSTYAICAVGFLTGLYFVSLQGRSALVIYFVQFLAVPLALGFYSLPMRLNLKTILSLTLLLAALLALSSITAFLQYIRWSDLIMTPRNLLGLYLDFLTSDQNIETNQLVRDNLSSRPLVLWSLAAAIDMHLKNINIDLIYFQDLVGSFLSSLPRPVYPYKDSLVLQESLLYTYFPFSNVDVADSPYLYAFASFSLMGLFVYPFVMSLLYSFCITSTLFISARLTSLPKLICSLTLFSSLITYSVLSFNELATPGLFRLFQLPPIAAVVLLVSRPLLNLFKV